MRYGKSRGFRQTGQTVTLMVGTTTKQLALNSTITSDNRRYSLSLDGASTLCLSVDFKHDYDENIGATFTLYIYGGAGIELALNQTISGGEFDGYTLKYDEDKLTFGKLASV